MDDPQTYLLAKQVRARYGVSDMCLWRWLHNETLGFPQPILLGKRRFWKIAELEVWEEGKRSKQKSQEAPHASAA
jgi:predicted DNA-binding transcriptional regulator AlpA